MDVTIVIATYGDQGWLELATGRAVRSAFALGVPVIFVHGLTLHDARNAGLAQVRTEHVVFLDGDDELDPGYLTAMATGTADLRAPAVQYVRAGGRAHPPYVPKVAGHQHDCTADCLRDGNWLVVGTLCPTRLLRNVGAWRDYDVYEDWDLFQRCWLAGATVEAIPNAIYVAHVRADSRNRGASIERKNRVHRQIVAANLNAVPA